MAADALKARDEPRLRELEAFAHERFATASDCLWKTRDASYLEDKELINSVGAMIEAMIQAVDRTEESYERAKHDGATFI